MKANGRTINFMEKGFLNTLMEESIKENGQRDRCMVVVFILGLQANHMKASIKMG